MLIYNVTTHVEPSVEQDWLVWMKQKHLPQMLATKKFIHAKIFKINSEHDQGGISYAVQYHCTDQKTLNQYLKNDAECMRKEGIEKFGNNLLFFRTELQLIEEQS